MEYQAGRVPNPDRIFFDLSNTKLSSTLVGKSFDVQDGFLKKIRVGQYQRDSTRVVLEVDDLSEYSAFVLPNPYRLIIDIHGRKAAPTEVARIRPRLKRRSAGEKFAIDRLRQLGRSLGCAYRRHSRLTAIVRASWRTRNRRASSTSKAANEVAKSETPSASAPPAKTASAKSSSGKTAQTKLQADKSDELLASASKTSGEGIKATSEPTSRPTAVAVAPRDKSAKKASKFSQAQIAAAREARRPRPAIAA